MEAKASPRPPERRISQPVAGERRTAAAMPRPRVVHAWDGRLATTRRPFRFFLPPAAHSPIATATVRPPPVELPESARADESLAGEVVRIGERAGHAGGLGARAVGEVQH